MPISLLAPRTPHTPNSCEGPASDERSRGESGPGRAARQTSHQTSRKPGTRCRKRKTGNRSHSRNTDSYSRKSHTTTARWRRPILAQVLSRPIPNRLCASPIRLHANLLRPRAIRHHAIRLRAIRLRANPFRLRGTRRHGILRLFRLRGTRHHGILRRMREPARYQVELTPLLKLEFHKNLPKAPARKCQR
jgi:hypothetical protein